MIKEPKYRKGFIRQLIGKAWRSSDDYAWRTVTRARHDPSQVTFVGVRFIEGIMYDVFRTPGGFEAQESNDELD